MKPNWDSMGNHSIFSMKCFPPQDLHHGWSGFACTADAAQWRVFLCFPDFFGGLSFRCLFVYPFFFAVPKVTMNRLSLGSTVVVFPWFSPSNRPWLERTGTMVAAAAKDNGCIKGGNGDALAANLLEVYGRWKSRVFMSLFNVCHCLECVSDIYIV